MNKFDQKTKDPHYVPVMYLKNFADIPSNGKKRTRRAKIFYFDKLEKGDIDRSSTGKECTKPYFYDQEIEELLNQRIETPLLNTTFQKIISEASLDDLTNKQFNMIKLFTLVQTNRTEYRIRYYQELIDWAKTLPKEVYSKSLDVVLGKDLPTQNELQASESFLKKMVKNDILMAMKYVSILKEFSWTLYLNHTKLPFYTSDNPIINKSEIFFRFNKPKIQTGQFNERVYVLPICPNLIIKLSKPVDSTFEFKIRSEKVSNEMKVVMYNNEIFRNAESKVYMKEKKESILRNIISFEPKCLERKSYIRKFIPRNQTEDFKVEVFKDS